MTVGSIQGEKQYTFFAIDTLQGIYPTVYVISREYIPFYSGYNLQYLESMILFIGAR